MYDFLIASSSVFVTFMMLVGFIVLGAVLLFEFGAVAYFYIKHAFVESRKTRLTSHRIGNTLTYDS